MPAAVDPYVGEFDTEYLRIQSASAGAWLHAGDGGMVEWQADGGDARDLRSHWYLEAAGNENEYYIRSRLTGGALQAGGQYGPLQPGDPAQRWIFGPAPPHFLLRAASQLPEQAQRVDLQALPRGAMLPWTSYDEDNFDSLTEPAHVARTSYDADFEPYSPAAEAQKNGCIVLNGYGTRVNWTVREDANALVIRYSVPDGAAGTITLTITPQGGGAARVTKVPVTAAQAWVYFENGEEYNTDAPGRIPAKRFAEARLLLDTPAMAGDTLSLARENGDELVWVDVVELETTSAFVPADLPDYYVATASPWNAKGDGVANDYFAILNCLNDAAAAGRKVYLPAGRYKVPYELILPPGAVLQGAGMWHTELYFSGSGSQTSGGVRGDGSDMLLRDLYIRGSQVSRSGGYKGIKGNWGAGSLIENVWIENTETGMWIADYYGTLGVTDGLVVRNCRIRNTFADGINMAEGTRNAVVDNCHFRSAGDDALASWASGRKENLGATFNQRFRYNTIECGYRAGGIGIFGGGAHEIHHNVIRDQYVGAGIRLNTVFIWLDFNGPQGYPFNASGDPIRIYANTLVRTGARSLYAEEVAALDLVTRDTWVENIEFHDLVIEQSQFSGIRFQGNQTLANPLPRFGNLSFRNIRISGVPVGTRATGLALGSAQYRDVTVAPPAAATSLKNGFTLSTSSAFAEWQVLHFGSTTAPAADPLADANGNGVPNLLEFAFGADPNNTGAAASRLPRPRVVKDGESVVLELGYRVRAGRGNGDSVNGFVIDGITYKPEAATDLSLSAGPSGEGTLIPYGSRIDNGDGTETVTVRTGPDGTAKFARVRVNRN